MTSPLIPLLIAAVALCSAARAGVPPQDASSFAEGNPDLPWNAKYQLGVDSKPQPSVPQGRLTKCRWESKQIYPGVSRDYWLYVPKQYDAAKPACLMVFQDGENYIGPSVNAPVVFDNWPLANQQMAAALKYKGYDYKFEFGDAGHNLKHGGAIFPDMMRWLWRDHPKSSTD